MTCPEYNCLCVVHKIATVVSVFNESLIYHDEHKKSLRFSVECRNAPLLFQACHLSKPVKLISEGCYFLGIGTIKNIFRYKLIIITSSCYAISFSKEKANYCKVEFHKTADVRMV